MTEAVSNFSTRMMNVHCRLDALFSQHQRALLDRDLVRAGIWLDSYCEQLAVHMEDEEHFVIPLYQQLGGDGTDAPAKLFLGEHAKLREFMARIGAVTAALATQPDDRELLKLFDLEASYKNLLLHHDLRERNALYPRLLTRSSREQGTALAAALRSC